MRYTDPTGLSTAELDYTKYEGMEDYQVPAPPEQKAGAGQPTVSAWDPNESKGSVEHYYFSPEGPEANGTKLIWAEAKLDTTDGAAISASAGFASTSGETNTPVFIGGDVDIINAKGQISFTNDGVNVGGSASLFSVGLKGGFKLGRFRVGVGGSLGIQAGFELEGTKNGFVLDAAWILGARVEVNWNRKEE